jgi:hypothetical protein
MFCYRILRIIHKKIKTAIETTKIPTITVSWSTQTCHHSETNCEAGISCSEDGLEARPQGGEGGREVVITYQAKSIKEKNGESRCCTVDSKD